MSCPARDVLLSRMSRLRSVLWRLRAFGHGEHDQDEGTECHRVLARCTYRGTTLAVRPCLCNRALRPGGGQPRSSAGTSGPARAVGCPGSAPVR